MKQQQNDFRLIDGGSVWILIPISADCLRWVEDNVSTDCPTYVPVECRYIENLVEGLADSGFVGGY